ncbi:uncharacterized protein NDAI_0B00730 [Naumovozyma dairenensis CBS 421]|uniref:Uncharacterized protein n=1 Tax=Naumovozyma dairenensis (strain ATCC 10597 / BCRC 20456 / CBS 421 / NBRC 0211 / NRRL Y-12639) TaxID=1071378 RepID=G0W5P6_NAUDC|nr:hypothetical protein NDAI_0B00730 [Naumovozyma dairenensis CBS 421]CCD23107.1 hypothetical protein NDAI_0B00730 [Naumovozyma dairenensis CBS 421]
MSNIKKHLGNNNSKFPKPSIGTSKSHILNEILKMQNRKHNNKATITRKGEGEIKEVSSADGKIVPVRNAIITDPILDAFQEAEPFQQALGNASNGGNNCRSFLNDAKRYKYRDVFGRKIKVRDRSNPTRERDERPLDTIKGFQYSLTKDSNLKKNLETSTLGFNPRCSSNYY